VEAGRGSPGKALGGGVPGNWHQAEWVERHLHRDGAGAASLRRSSPSASRVGGARAWAPLGRRRRPSNAVGTRQTRRRMRPDLRLGPVGSTGRGRAGDHEMPSASQCPDCQPPWRRGRNEGSQHSTLKRWATRNGPLSGSPPGPVVPRDRTRDHYRGGPKAVVRERAGSRRGSQRVAGCGEKAWLEGGAHLDP